MPIIKTLTKATKLEKEQFKIPKSVQDAIPIQRIWPDGIFQVGSRFSKTFSFTDINYSIASKDDKTAMFLDYSELLNALDSGASAKITIHNRRIDKAQFEKSLLLPMREDGLDHFRREYNEMLLSKVTGTNNSVVQDRYITITVVRKIPHGRRIVHCGLIVLVSHHFKNPHNFHIHFGIIGIRVIDSNNFAADFQSILFSTFPADDKAIGHILCDMGPFNQFKSS